MVGTLTGRSTGRHRRTGVVIAALGLCLAAGASAQSTGLAGLRETTLRFGPHIRGERQGWRESAAALHGFYLLSRVTVPVTTEAFTLADPLPRRRLSDSAPL